MRVFAVAGTLFLVLVINASAQSKASESNRSFYSARPYLLALSVSNLDETLKWYGEKLGFTVVRRVEIPQNSLRIAFIELNDFQLEVIEFKQSVSFDRLQKQYPSVDDRAKIQGMTKLAFMVDDIEGAAAKLRVKGARFERPISDDKESGTKWFIVTDNDGNWIQFFQKVPASKPKS